MFCPACGNPTQPGDRHCNACGASLRRGIAPAASPRTAAQPKTAGGSAKLAAGAVAVLVVLAAAGFAYWWLGPRAVAARAQDRRAEPLEVAADFCEALLAHDADAVLDTLPAYFEFFGKSDSQLLAEQWGRFDVISRDEEPGREIVLRIESAEEGLPEGSEAVTATVTFELEESEPERALVFYDADKDGSEVLDELRAELVNGASLEDGSGAPQLTEEQLQEGLPPGAPQLTDDQLQPGLPEGHPPLPGAGE